MTRVKRVSAGIMEQGGQVAGQVGHVAEQGAAKAKEFVTGLF